MAIIRRIGDPKPQDKLIIFEDTNNDGKADKQTNDDLHIPIGFEISHDGVCLRIKFSFAKDTDGDDRYDEKEVVLSGFDDHDTHHAISAFVLTHPVRSLWEKESFCTVTLKQYSVRSVEPMGLFPLCSSKQEFNQTCPIEVLTLGDAVDSFEQNFLFSSGPSVSWMLPGNINAGEPTFQQTICSKAIKYDPHQVWKLYPADTFRRSARRYSDQ